MDVRAAALGLSWWGKWEGALSMKFTHIKEIVVSRFSCVFLFFLALKYLIFRLNGV